MLIRVRFRDGHMGVVSSRELDPLLREGRIAQFERSTGWVDVEEGPLRRGGDTPSDARERRAFVAYSRLLREIEASLAS